MDIKEKALQVLKSIGYQVSGYYPYDHAVNLVGFLPQPSPFDTAIKMAVEIAQSPISTESIESFAKFGKNVLALKLALFYADDFKDLEREIQNTLILLKVDYVGGKRLEKELLKSSLSVEETKEIKNSLDVLSPKRLIEAIPELSQRKIPKDIKDTLNGRFKAWEIMEDAVFATFFYAFMFETKQLGREKKFHDEPEGIVIISNQQPFALLYDCKSTKKEKYKMPIDDERAIISYINDKKAEINIKYRCELRYFIVVSSCFGGDVELRRNNVHNATNVELVCMEATALSKFALWAHKLPIPYKKLIDLKKIFKFGEKIVGDKMIEDFIKEFDNTHKNAYEGD